MTQGSYDCYATRKDDAIATGTVSPVLASEAQDWSLIPLVCRRVEEAHAVIRRVQLTKRTALPHLISAELRFPEHMEMFKPGTLAHNFYLRNFNDRTMLWSILKCTGMPNTELCRLVPKRGCWEVCFLHISLEQYILY
jgi:hypothetical protein